MATKQRYINTASSAGGDGTTNATTGANRAFAGWVEFEAVEGALDAAGDIYNVQVSGYENLGTTRLIYNGFATTVTVNFYAATGEECQALPSQGAGFTHSGSLNHLWYSPFTFTDLRFVATGTGANFQFADPGIGYNQTWTNCYINKNIAWAHKASYAPTLTLKNSVLVGQITLSVGEAAYKNTVKLVNSVVTGQIVTYDYNTVSATNSSFTAADWLLGAGTYTGATTNAVDCLFAEAYDAAQFNGTYSGCTHSINFASYFADSANGNYNLTSSATAALDAGVGTSDGDVPASDANGVARGTTTCDIGPYELAGGAEQSLAGTAAAVAAAVGSISVAVPLAGASIAVAAATGSISVSIPLAGVAQGLAAATGALSTSAEASLAGAATVVANATGGLSLSIPLMGTAVAQALAQAALSLGVPLAGVAAGIAAAAGSLGVAKGLSGAAQAQASGLGAVTLNITLSGAAIAAAAASAGLTVTGALTLSGAAAAEVSASGALSLALPLSGAALTVASASGGLTQIVPLSSSAAAASIASGGLDVSVTLSGNALAQALAAAAMSVGVNLSGAASIEAVASGALTLRINMAGAAVAQAIAAGALAGPGVIIPDPDYRRVVPMRAYQVSAPFRDYRATVPHRSYRVAA